MIPLNLFGLFQLGHSEKDPNVYETGPVDSKYDYFIQSETWAFWNILFQDLIEDRT
jgi:hypothetical protein